jgi:hypothetical protein
MLTMMITHFITFCYNNRKVQGKIYYPDSLARQSGFLSNPESFYCKLLNTWNNELIDFKCKIGVCCASKVQAKRSWGGAAG